MATRNKTHSLVAAVCVVAVGLFVRAGHAGDVAPELTIDVWIDGNWMWGDAPVGDPIPNTSTYYYESAYDGADWAIDFTSVADPDPFVNNNLVITNNTGVTQNYLVSVTLPIAPPVGAPSSMNGSVGVTLTDSNNDGSALLESIGGAVYGGLIDGATVSSLLSGAPYSLSVASSGGTSVDNDSFGPSPGPAAGVSIGIELEFTLSAGDSVAITSFFEVVPAPGAMTLLGMAGCLGFRRRRRTA